MKLTPTITLGSSGQFRCRTALSWRRVHRIKITCKLLVQPVGPCAPLPPGPRSVPGRDAFVIDQHVLVYPTPNVPETRLNIIKKKTYASKRCCSSNKSTVLVSDRYTCDNMTKINRRATPTPRVIQTDVCRFMFESACVSLHMRRMCAVLNFRFAVAPGVL